MIDEIKKRYSFDNWIVKENKMIKKYILPINNLVGLSIDKQAFYEYESDKKIYEYILHGPNSIRIMISVIECNSIKIAQESLINFLDSYSEFSLKELEIGDVSYIIKNSIAFIKSNFYVRIISVGNIFNVDEISKKIEESI